MTEHRAVRPLILASGSPRRRHILKSLRVPFRVIRPNIQENLAETNPRRLVQELALKKASSVARKHKRALVLGADTVVVCRGAILGKPKDAADSLRMLSALNGRWHRVYTGVALVDAQSGRHWKEFMVTRVKARKLDKKTLERLAGKHMDKAGAYAMQDRNDPFIEKVMGHVDNVVGLPLASVRNLIRKAVNHNRQR